MPTKNRYTTSDSCLFSLNYHFVWCTKYCRKVITEAIERRLRLLIFQKAEELNVEILGVECSQYYLHIYLKSSPTLAPHFIVQQFKGYTSRLLRQEFAELRSRVPSLWTRPYMCMTNENFTYELLAKFISNQKKH